MYDVIIAGAGPAGSTVAKVLAEKGYRVLLCERFKIPRYKSCSGQLIKKTIDFVQTYLGEAVSSSVMCEPTENRGMIFTDDKGREFRFEQEGLNVWRSSFDEFLTMKSKQAGAEVRDETGVISVTEENDILTIMLKGQNTYSEQSHYFVDCEGVTGAIKRKLLGEQPRHITTFQTYNEGSIELDPHYFYAYLQPDLSEYDAWFNVKDNMLVLGVSVKDPKNIEMYYERFIRYMTQKHNLKILNQVRTDKWLMPQIVPDCPIDYGTGRVLFAGEIAGFLNPMGEGISGAMESGYSVALSISEHFNNPDMVLTAYRDKTTPLREYMKRQWSFVGSMADTFSEMK